MADLQAIYQEFGTSGLIPYALTPGSKGRQLLIDKIKEGASLYYLESVFGTPFIRVYDGSYHMVAYTEEQEAEAAREAAQQDRYETVVRALPAEDREEAVKRLFSSGPEAIRIDDALSIPLKQLAEVPTYDGRPTTDFILLNRDLNGAVFYYFQTAYAQKNNAAAERRWAETMFQSEFLVAVEDDAANGYPFLTTTVNKTTCLYIFSDWDEVTKVFPGKAPACIIAKFEELDNVLDQFPGCKLLFNQGSCHFLMDPNMMLTIRTILNSANFTHDEPIVTPQVMKNNSTPAAALSQVPEDDWDSADPTPDWLK